MLSLFEWVDRLQLIDKGFILIKKYYFIKRRKINLTFHVVLIFFHFKENLPFPQEYLLYPQKNLVQAIFYHIDFS